jgi:flagellar basal-body rod protein FlgB
MPGVEGGKICRGAGKCRSAAAAERWQMPAGSPPKEVARLLLVDCSREQDTEGTLMVGKIQDSLSFQLQALTLRAERQQVLAGNIANADTPHYQARDFDFASTLQQAVSGREQAGLRLATLGLATTSPQHSPGRAAADPLQLLYRQPTQASADGNTVDMDVERAQFAENSFFYEAGLTFLSGRINTLRTAIQGQ